jgi:hypothetical protein
VRHRIVAFLRNVRGLPSSQGVGHRPGGAVLTACQPARKSRERPSQVFPPESE